MQTVYPDYYNDFKCINKKCKHNCCIGWEIDIDSETASFYRNHKGKFSEKFRSHINWDDEPYFILSENERCPFLNEDNLCEIIINFGENALCTICSEHPRFTNQLPDRNEIGLGLCCEAAGNLILRKKEPVKLIIESEFQISDEIIVLRDKIIQILQNREKSISNRINDMLKTCNCVMPNKAYNEYIDFLLSLERLDSKWDEILKFAKKNFQNADFESFEIHMKDRQTEYEQLLVYFIYRHFANAPKLKYTAEKALFSAFAYKIIYTIGAVIFTNTNKFSFEEQVEIARMFSSEIEYSDENIYLIFDFLTD